MLRAQRLKFAGLFMLGGLPVSPMLCSQERAETAAPPQPEIVRVDALEAAPEAPAAQDDVSYQLAEGLKMEIWADEDLVQDPVALDVDNQGRVYYIRTNRLRNSEFDIRGHQDWMIASISFNTVEDRRAFLKRRLAPERSADSEFMADLNGDGSHDWRDLLVEKEEIHRVEDTDGDGKADTRQVFIEDFHTEVTDVAGGLMVDGNSVFLGLAPDFWRIDDTDGDGVADRKQSLSHGYQVHIGFGAHGMSGPLFGPDGRVYWSIGDIGSNVVAPDGKRWENPHRGAIFRANPDGSDFEVFAHGLRNTHEFAFDEYGNLISVDNDGDHPGEHERIVYVTNGSDSGWRTHWQFGKYVDPDNNLYKVWMDEGYYKPRFEGQAAFITPPVAAYHAGPSGVVYNPGTALSPEWKNHFFVSEFTGSPNSRISAFTLEPDGANFALAGEKQVLKGINATGLAFGPDGAMYFGDWVEGWSTKDRGRIWKLDVEGAAGSPARAETERLLAEDFAQRSESDLAQILRNADQRVRQKAQFALVDRGAAKTLLAAAKQKDHQFARIHALWGIGQLARKDAKHASELTAFLKDADPEVRAQAAKVIGDVRYAGAAKQLIPLLEDDAARPRFFAAEALGRIGYEPAVQPIIAMLEANDGEDVQLRHAGTLALARIGVAEPVVALASHPSKALRLAAVVALRRMEHPGVARFLDDKDEHVVTEAARAINDDASIPGALPALAAALTKTPFQNEPLIRRAINANLRLGKAEHARAVAEYAARTDAPDPLRVEALAVLGVWPKPSVLDRVDGRYRGEFTRNPEIARTALAAIVEPLFAQGSAAVKMAAAESAGRLKYEPAVASLRNLLQRDAEPEVRIAALKALHAMGGAGLGQDVRTALADRDATVRMAALQLTPTLDVPKAAVADLLAPVLANGSVEEQQTALGVLGKLQEPRSVELLGGMVNRLTAGTLPPAIQLDVMEAAEASGSDALRQRVEQYRTAQSASLAASVADITQGGDVRRGRRLFYTHPGGMCTRCHAVRGQGGEVGPDLTAVGARATREYLAESLIDPNARIAPGYGNVSLTLRNGQTAFGLLKSETETELTLQTGDVVEPLKIAKSEITERQDGPSGMPPMGHVLTRRELRDMVEYLASLQGAQATGGHGGGN